MDDPASAIDVEGGAVAAGVVAPDVVSLDLAFVVEKCRTEDGTVPRMAAGLNRWAARVGRLEMASNERSPTMTF